MPYLEACLEGENQSGPKRWQKALPIDREVSVGRIPRDHPDPGTEEYNRSEWVIPDTTDTYISGCHVYLKWSSVEGKLHVRRRLKPRATANPVIYRNKPADNFVLSPGESFWIGRHKFTLHGGELSTTSERRDLDIPPLKKEPPPNQNVSQPHEQPNKLPGVQPPPIPQNVPPPIPKQNEPIQVEVDREPDPADSGVYRSASPESLQEETFINAQARLNALTRLIDLPKKGINEEDLEKNLLQLLLDELPQATAAVVVQLLPESTPTNPDCFVKRALKRHGSNTKNYVVSKRLVYSVVRKRPECRLQLWFRGMEVGGFNSGGFTMMASSGVDWTICCPLGSRYTQDWALYIDGELPKNITKQSLDTYEREELHDYQKFIEQAARVLTNVRTIRALERRVRQLEQFVPPRVLVAMNHIEVSKLFAPKAIPVTVLFCDLRSSCKMAEKGANPESLNDLRDQIRGALGIMTGAINTHQGVVGDLQGDAAMGFWGWPTEQPDSIDRACHAALNIAQQFFKTYRPFSGSANSSSSDMKCGIGIAHGLALAGALGTSEHIKSDVFGPVVNLSARLEGMTKYLGVPIIVDEAVADHMRGYRQKDLAAPRTRLMGRFIPSGMSEPIKVYELLPPEGMPVRNNIPENLRLSWEAAVETFLEGDWLEARHRIDDYINNASGSGDFDAGKSAYLSGERSERPDHLKAAYLMLKFMDDHNNTLPLPEKEWQEKGAISLSK